MIKIQHYHHIPAILVLLAFTGFYSSVTNAQKIPDFSAKFDVEAFGMKLGQAKQELTCKNELCTLTSHAKPSGLAAMLSSDSSKETIKLKQTKTKLTWLNYHKVGKSEKNGETVKKYRTLKLNPEAKQINSFKNKRFKKSWPSQNNLFDSVSFAYGIQFAVLNKQPIEQFFLQDISFQDPLKLVSKEQGQNLELPFKSDFKNAVKYNFKSEHAKITLWLLPTYLYFPSKIQIINDNDKTITLFLAEPPKLYETQR